MIVHRFPQMDSIFIVEDDGVFTIREMATAQHYFDWPHTFSSLISAKKEIEYELVGCFRRRLQRSLDFTMASLEQE